MPDRYIVHRADKGHPEVDMGDLHQMVGLFPIGTRPSLLVVLIYHDLDDCVGIQSYCL